jgi:hypothetical protein
MSIRSLARELYKAQQKESELQIKFDSAPQDIKDVLAQELNYARKELQMLRRMLDGEKQSGTFRLRFSGFGNTKK